MALLDKFTTLARQHAALRAAGGDQVGLCIERILSPTEAMIDGRKFLLLGTNNYLGLTFDAEAAGAACEAIREQGVGTTGSRVANGTYAGHEALEREIAAYYGRRAAVLFTTGYQANLGTISALVGPADTLVIDADSHASIYDAAALCGATVLRFKHNDAADLDRRLARLEHPENALVVVEGIYSMLGDRAPLAEIAAVKRRHGALLLVDEAHALGVLGATGRGLAEEVGVEADADFVVGTFSKSMAVIGGYCVSDHAALDGLRVSARSYLFSASSPPAIIAAARRTLARVASSNDLRAALWRNARRLYRGLGRVGFALGPEESPLVAIRLASRDEVVAYWQALYRAGIYVNLAIPPATPNGTNLLRTSVCAAHTSAQIDHVLDVLATLRQELAPVPG